MRRTRFGLGFCVVVALALTPTLGQAAVFTGTDQGVTITLDETLSGNLLDIVLTLDTSGYTGPGDFLHAISLKAVEPIELGDITEVALPGGTGDWDTVLGQLNNSGSIGSGSGWFSSLYNVDVTGLGVPDGPYVFQYQIDLTAGSTTSSVLSDPPFKALYVYTTGEKANGLTSITLAPVPEPGTLLLIGSGLVGMGSAARRRHRRK